jgi:hypothetical protein
MSTTPPPTQGISYAPVEWSGPRSLMTPRVPTVPPQILYTGCGPGGIRRGGRVA